MDSYPDTDIDQKSGLVLAKTKRPKTIGEDQRTKNTFGLPDHGPAIYIIPSTRLSVHWIHPLYTCNICNTFY